MVSRRHDFTDSEPEIEVEEGDSGREEGEGGPSNPRKRQFSEGPAESSNAGGYSRGGSEEFDELLDEHPEEVVAKPTPPSSKKGKKGKEGKPLKITLRPGISQLMNSDSQPSTSTSKSKAKPIIPKHSDRSSLSPPPPITLKFGIKSTMAEKASYSSSEDDDPLPISAPPSKKKKTTSSNGGPSSTGKGKAKGQSQTSSISDKSAASAAAAAAAAAHRKSYDWLAPSVAGASHRGPAEREKEREKQGSNGKITGWSPADEAIGGLLDDSPDTTAEKKPKKSHKKKAADAPPGPGKAWRKGIKKGMTTAVKAEETLSTPGGSPLIHAATPMSRETTPDPLEMPPRMMIAPAVAPIPRAPSPPFVLADAKELGFPVFSNPIHAPKVPLGVFPKVTQYFAPLNGGDVGPFPRKEPVRNWTQSEKVMVGIAGGQLKIKSWIMGPPSELGRLVAADKEAKEIARLAKIKSNNANNANNNNNTTNANNTTPGTSTPILDSTERPNLNSMNSFDASTSTLPTPILAPSSVAGKGMDNDEEMSEIADLDDESNAPQSGTTTPIPIPTPTATATPKIKVKVGSSSGGGSKNKKAAPRKSALRQEIVPSEENSEFELDQNQLGGTENDDSVAVQGS